MIAAQKYSVTNKVKLTMSDIQSEITRQAKSQENATHNEKEKKGPENGPDGRMSTPGIKSCDYSICSQSWREELTC